MSTAPRRFAFLAGLIAILAAILPGCATDGGVGGTGISVIDGNVASGSAVGVTAAAQVVPAPAGIIVRLRGTDVETVTGADGGFRLEGDFSGLATVDFIAADHLANSLQLVVPAGGQVTLVNVRFDTPHQLALADAIQVDFEAVALANAACDGSQGTLQVRDRSDRANVFAVQLTAATKIEADDMPGATVLCSDIGDGQPLRIRGTDIGDTILAVRVRLLRSRAVR